MKSKGSTPLAIVVALLLFVASALLIPRLPLEGPRYSSDELVWIASGHYAFHKLFVERDTSAETWNENRFGSFGRPVPTVGKLLIGASLHASGYREAGPILPGFESSTGFSWNRLKRTRPPPELLAAARRPAHWLAAFSCALLFFLARDLTGSWRIGVVAGLLFAVDPLVLRDSRRATLDLPALAFSIAALTLAADVWRRELAPLRATTVARFLALGVVCGLAVGTKLNAVLGVSVCLLWGAARLVAIAPAAGAGSRWSALARDPRTRSGAVGGVLVVVVAGAVFVASNPYLYRDTATHALRLVEHGSEVAELEPPAAQRLDSWPRRVQNLWRVGADTSAPLRRWLGLPWVDGLLILSGVALAARRIGRRDRTPDERLGDVWLLLWVAVVVAGIVAWAPFKWARFYLPLEPAWCVLEALALAAIASAGAALVAKRRAGRAYSGP